ncbi:hypothetical protein JCM10908_000318 [Rhodotorula pacifica]|uniref:uncharacterized protein n=1 Tax=Rhodotorula pacifica TaxID=1495444 RepID=UPI00316CB60C
MDSTKNALKHDGDGLSTHTRPEPHSKSTRLSALSPTFVPQQYSPAGLLDGPQDFARQQGNRHAAPLYGLAPDPNPGVYAPEPPRLAPIPTAVAHASSHQAVATTASPASSWPFDMQKRVKEYQGAPRFKRPRTPGGSPMTLPGEYAPHYYGDKKRDGRAGRKHRAGKDSMRPPTHRPNYQHDSFCPPSYGTWSSFGSPTLPTSILPMPTGGFAKVLDEKVAAHRSSGQDDVWARTAASQQMRSNDDPRALAATWVQWSARCALIQNRKDMTMREQALALAWQGAFPTPHLRRGD